MTDIDAPRLEGATEALRALLPFTHPADAALRAFFRDHPKLGQRDRGVIAELSFAVIRHLRLLESLTQGRDPRRLLLAAAMIVAGRSVRQLEPALKRGEAEWLAQLRAVDTAALPIAVQVSLPDWIWDAMIAQMAQPDALALARSLLNPAPLDLRVNALRADRDALLAQLRAEGLAAEAMPYSPVGVRLQEKTALQRHPRFLDGSLEVQDEASQLLGLLVAPRRREMVVDFCAGAGGKTLALGALMRSEGRLYAFDTSQKRLANLAPRLKRSGLSNVHPQLIDGEHDRRIQRLHGKIDRVLVDAPCSGLGTLRRNPDLKWRQTPQSVRELTAKQASILTAAAELVKPGGRLVYATCSILREENDGIVDDFLTAHPQFEAEPAQGLLAAQGVAIECGERFRVLPHRHAMDGFFACVLKRRAGS